MANAFTPAPIDVDRLRTEVRLKYREVATNPDKGFHFHLGRPLAAMLDYPVDTVAALPDQVVESFAGVNNPFSMGIPARRSWTSVRAPASIPSSPPGWLRCLAV